MARFEPRDGRLRPREPVWQGYHTDSPAAGRESAARAMCSTVTDVGRAFQVARKSKFFWRVLEETRDDRRRSQGFFFLNSPPIASIALFGLGCCCCCCAREP